MKNAIILHGMPSRKSYFDATREDAQSNSHWIPWIQQQLLLKGILAQAPELPRPYEPVYEDWKSVFEGFDINADTILIGHSCGAGFLVRWLSENKIKVGKVVLVAPWIDPDHKHAPEFFDFDIDPAIAERTDGLTVFISEDDDQEMLTSVDILNKKIGAIHTIRMEGKQHFCLGDMGTREFPELRDLIFD